MHGRRRSLRRRRGAARGGPLVTIRLGVPCSATQTVTTRAEGLAACIGRRVLLLSRCVRSYPYHTFLPIPWRTFLPIPWRISLVLAAPSPTASESTQNTLRFGSSHLIFNLLRFEAAMALAYAAAASAAAIETVVI